MFNFDHFPLFKQQTPFEKIMNSISSASAGTGADARTSAGAGTGASADADAGTGTGAGTGTSAYASADADADADARAGRAAAAERTSFFKGLDAYLEKVLPVASLEEAKASWECAPMRVECSLRFLTHMDEHTPLKEEWEQIRRDPMCRSFFRSIGGIKQPKLVRCGPHAMFKNWGHVQSYMSDNPAARLVSGWCLLVGKPTGLLAIPFFWVRERDAWYSVCGFEDERVIMLCESKDPVVCAAFKEIELSGQTWRSVAINPIIPTQHQTCEEFVSTNYTGNVSSIVAYHP
jgi:hypothetical protein